MIRDINDMGLERMSYPHLTGLPEILPSTEATADASTFVCEFLGGSSANETGVGGGLTGADLVLTQSGSIAASSSGYRALDGSNDYFSATATFAAAFFNASEWTYALKVKSLTAATVKYFWNYGTSSYSNMAYMHNVTPYAPRAQFTNDVAITICVLSAIPSTTSATWICEWKKNGVLHLGWVTQEALPTGWDSFPQNQRVAFYGLADFSGTWTTMHAVGSSSGYPAMSIGVLVASKIGLSAAPV